MKDSSSKIMDDLSKLAMGAAGAAQGIRQEAEQLVQKHVDKIVRELDLVSREEFEVVREMAIKARAENETLRQELGKGQKKPKK